VYRASADTLVVGITIVVVIVLVAVAVGGIVGAVMVRAPRMVQITLLFPAVTCVGIIAVAYAYTPRAFRLGDDALVVARLAGDVTVPLRDIRTVQSVPSPLAGSVRVAGNGGLFGFWGRYRSEALNGNFTFYGTRATGGVALTTSDGTVVITPDDPDRFVIDIERRLGHAAAG